MPLDIIDYKILDKSINFLLDAIPSTTFVAFTNSNPILGPSPSSTFCMSCRKTVLTIISIQEYSPPLAWLVGGLLCMIG